MAATSAGINKYINNHYEGMSPERLILMLFNGALDRIKDTRDGIRENNIQKRGENLSKVIAIVSELNTSLNPEMNDEATEFLRGLYMAILTELPKVSTTNDVEILNRTERYIGRLREIWVNDVMNQKQSVPIPAQKSSQSTSRLKSISV